MRYVALVVKLLLFLLLFGFCMHNSQSTEVRFFLGYAWQAPMFVILFIAFALGALLGIVVSSLRVMRTRKELLNLRREIRARQQSSIPVVPSDAL